MNNEPQKNRSFFVNQGKNDLLITIGDSWTWGSSLGDLSVDYRSKHVYGRHLSEQLECDWINYGLVARGNNEILSNLDLILQCVFADDFDSNLSKYDFLADFDYKNLSDLATKKYQQIYIVITLTETGRDSYDNSAKDQFTEVKNFLIDDELHVYRKITKLKEQYKNTNLVVARNFSCDFGECSNSISVEKNWIQINFEENQRRGFDNFGYTLEDISNSGAVSRIAMNKIRQLDYQDKKQYIIKQINNCDKLLHWLKNNPLHYNKSTCHPKEESHKLWADYLIQYFK